ncbi:MAG TPA: M1 family metallopeptidase [Flavisolibacter sp.]
MKFLLIRSFLLLMLAQVSLTAPAQPLSKKPGFTRQDTLRGSIGPARSWWDVLHYDITVTPDYESKTITGKTTITYKITGDRKSDYLQVDLQQPLTIDSIFYNNKLYINYPAKPYYNEGNAWFIPLPRASVGSTQQITLVYHGKPKEAKNAPWDGGWVFKKDEKGRPWMSVACQGQGASVWFPCKDHQGDEPDNGATMTVKVPEPLVAVGNGRLKNKVSANGMTSYTWNVTSPINSYTIIPYIGHYISWSDTLQGEKGTLPLTFWSLDYDEQQARKQFAQLKPTLRAMEFWLGPYPFYEDGFQLIQAPYLGMEHQSAVAYGNQFKNGYLGRDLSGSGWGMKWDYIIVHETAHEWFGNNITSKDIADMWVHESFTDYAETLFTEYYYGKQAANEYVQGLRKNIANDIPIIGPYGVNQEGSGDMYYKGANLVHMIRQIINNDSVFRRLLRGMNEDFYHKTVTTAEIESYINRVSGKDFSKVFNQYLRTANIPTLELKADGDKMKFRWTDAVAGFNMPVRLTNGQWIYPTTAEQKIKIENANFSGVDVDKNFYIRVKK